MSTGSPPPFGPEVERWRKYLRKDPTRFLLDPEANPSVLLWYAIDIAHRPENSSAVIQARERVLYSDSVQEIFAAQRPEGYWHSPDSLSQPYFKATLWNLALLAELGIPRDSRRARAACEFALQNFLDDDRFSGVNAVEAGYLVGALTYFRRGTDERVVRAARALIRLVQDDASDEARIVALRAWQGLAQDAEISSAAHEQLERLLDSLATRTEFAPMTFPPFDPRDALLILRVLAAFDRAHDPRVAHMVDALMQKQNESSQWPLEKSLNGQLLSRVEEESGASRWATLNAVRVIVRLVMNQEQAAP